MSTTTKLSDLFGSMVFNEDTMKERLSSASYEAWKKCVTDGTSLDISTANEIAQAMKQWAVEKGCRMYDFRGVSGDVSEDNPLYGLFRFKQGFGGDFTEFVGELDLVLDPFVYWCVEHGTSVFKELRRRLYLIKNRGK